MDEDEENDASEVAHLLALIGDKSDDLINGITHIAGLATRPRTLVRLAEVATPEWPPAQPKVGSK